MPVHQRHQLETACQGELPPLALAGIELFNRRAYFEAHEALEHAWRAEQGPIRELYRAILQIGIAYYQIRRRNYRGAVKMFRRCKAWLDPFPARCRGIDLADLRNNYLAAQAELLSLGPDRIGEFPAQMLKPVRFTTNPSGGANYESPD